MAKDSLEKIELLLKKLIGNLHALNQENGRLSKELGDLKSQLEKNAVGEEKLRSQLGKLSRLEKSCKKLESERKAIRSKVKNIISDLETVDWF